MICFGVILYIFAVAGGFESVSTYIMPSGPNRTSRIRARTSGSSNSGSSPITLFVFQSMCRRSSNWPPRPPAKMLSFQPGN